MRWWYKSQKWHRVVSSECLCISIKHVLLRIVYCWVNIHRLVWLLRCTILSGWRHILSGWRNILNGWRLWSVCCFVQGFNLFEMFIMYLSILERIVMVFIDQVQFPKISILFPHFQVVCCFDFSFALKLPTPGTL